jgi:hypothetical protein
MGCWCADPKERSHCLMKWKKSDTYPNVRNYPGKNPVHKRHNHMTHHSLSSSASPSHTRRWKQFCNCSIDSCSMASRTLTKLFTINIRQFISSLNLTFAAPGMFVAVPSYSTHLASASLVAGASFSITSCSMHWLEFVTSMHA